MLENTQKNFLMETVRIRNWNSSIKIANKKIFARNVCKNEKKTQIVRKNYCDENFSKRYPFNLVF